MEKVKAAEQNIEVYENEIDEYLHQFQIDQDIDDLRAIPQTVWNACLMYIQRHVFTDRSLLKQKNNIYTENTVIATNCNSYDYKLLNDICDYYIYIYVLYMIKNVVYMGTVN